MSGIVGLFRRDGRPVEKSDLDAMLGRISHRGPDAAAIWSDGPIGLGHCLLKTTPEAEYEKQPIIDNQAQLTLVADARIDNRDELIAALDIGGPVSQVSDSDLILAAYKKWGEGCPERLVGDFAFVVWNGREKSLFCARDHMGLRPLFHYCSDSLFAFASEIKSLLCLPEIPVRINELKVACHVVMWIGEKKETFYRGIERLPPAHSMLLTSDTKRQREYWRLDPKYEDRSLTDAEHVEKFRELFIETVRCRVRGNGPISSMLSGGLDSSSICCTAREILSERGDGPLHTFSMIFPTLPEKQLKAIDERPYMEAVVKMGGFDPHFVHADTLSPLMDLGTEFLPGDEPHLGFNLYLQAETMRIERRLGRRIHMEGLDGDTTVSYGYSHLTDLARTGRFWELSRLAGQIAGVTGFPTRRVIWAYGVKPIVPDFLFSTWRRLRGRPQKTQVESSGINPSFAKKTGLPEVMEEDQHRFRLRSARDGHYAGLSSPVITGVIELTGGLASVYGVEMRLPFFDKRLVEYSLSMPTRLKIKDGWPRWVLREAMDGILTPVVQWRPGKANLSSNFRMRLHDRDRALVEQVLQNDSKRLGDYCDMDKLRQSYNKVLTNSHPGSRDCMFVFCAVLLDLWLVRMERAEAFPENQSCPTPKALT